MSAQPLLRILATGKYSRGCCLPVAHAIVEPYPVGLDAAVCFNQSSRIRHRNGTRNDSNDL